ncbi:ABC transporter permease [Hoeflea poritis]|uniref:ABC transporter permease n=1 Tax=Hoeflea poritis TaxID=2993659 RepID=A0ABT4VWH2_9HYPH|nr:ABC transporter permease [Hoeflea poritis]MDA4848565.1 ABC transporter permease [Hoeflea poritis]
MLITVVGAVILTVYTDDFASPQNLSNLLSQAMPLIIVAIGQMIVIVIGGMDLSVGAIISLTTALLALDAPAFVLVPAVFAITALIGLVNGYSIVKLNVHPIIATLSVQFIVVGFARILRPVAGGSVPDIVVSCVAGTVFGIPLTVFWAVIVLLLGWKLIHGSRYGLHLFAIGGGVSSGQEDAAHNFGISDQRNVILAYVCSALFAALAGFYIAGRISSGDPGVGETFALDSVTAVAIGGTQLSGGIGSLHGTLFGAILMVLLSNGMNLANLSAFLQGAIKGAILLLVVSLQSRKKMGL